MSFAYFMRILFHFQTLFIWPEKKQTLIHKANDFVRYFENMKHVLLNN